MSRRTAAALAAALIVGGVAAARAQTQGQPRSQDIMPALLAEVRGLRAAMEQMASTGARVQLALGRVQLQEQRLNTVIRRLDETRSRLAQQQRAAAEHQDQLAMMEAAVKENNQGMGEEREHIEKMLTHQRRQSVRFAAEIQQLTADEAALANEVVSEQARWTAFNQRLEELEQGFGGR